MNKSKVFKLAALVLMISLLIPLSSYAQSESENFKLVIDVLAGLGGRSSSDSFVLAVSTGAQPSVVGKMNSTNFEVRSGYVYSAWVNHGDANGDGKINIGDVIYIANYIFKGGPAPKPWEAGDVDCGGTINVGDVIYLANYLLKGGPPPCSGGELSKLSKSSGSAEVGLVYAKHLDDPQASNRDVIEIPIFAKFDVDLAGAQFEIEYDPEKLEVLKPSLTPLSKQMELLSSTKDKIQKIGVLDFKVENYIPAGEGNIVRLRIKGKDFESLRIKEAILVDRDANEIPVEIIALAKGEEEKESTTLPENFSLSQNYPNPFNPTTEISYALPKDSKVKLTIYNVLGQKVKVLVNEYQTAGYKCIRWDGKNERGKNVATGIYFYLLDAGDFTQAKKMLLLK